MTSRKVVVATGTFTDVDVERDFLAGKDVEVSLANLRTPEEVAEATEVADAVIVSTNPLPKEMLKALGQRVKIIGRSGVGLDSIDLIAAADLGIAVFHCPDYCTDEVATHAIAMLLSLHRRLLQADQVARRDWRDWRQLTPFTPLHLQVAGVVGAGRIGAAVVQRLLPLVKSVVVYDPFAESVPPGALRMHSLEELLKSSDVVTLHSPLTPDTRHMINEQALSIMKSGSILINVSRGPLVDEVALAAALRAGKLTAGLDVLESEPPDSRNLLFAAPGLLLSPHFAWYSTESEVRARVITISGVIAYLNGETPDAGRMAAVPVNPRP
jgi:D-3-phosphoglycerate dehydrogenase